MRPLVMKFGGSALPSAEAFRGIAGLIRKRKEEFSRIVVVVSAMANATKELSSLAHQVHPSPPKREYDMLVTVGERISIALLAMALDLHAIPAMSFTGSQSGIITSLEHGEARIVALRPHRILSCLESDQVAIVAGFQGMSLNKEITTLGANGSDITAVALGVALGAERVELFKDVAGLYQEDPKKSNSAEFLSEVSYQKALEIVAKGGRILHPRSILLAEKNRLPLYVTSHQKMMNPPEKQLHTGSWIGGSVRTEFPLPLYEEVEPAYAER